MMTRRIPSVCTLLIPRMDGGSATDNAALSVLQRKVSDLESDNRKYRLRLNKYREIGTPEEITAKLAKIPGADAVVLTPAEAAERTAYIALGKLDEVKAKIESGEKATRDLAQRDHLDTARKACEVAELNADALLKLPGADKLKYEVRTEKVDGNDVPVAYVTDTAVQGAAPKKLTEHVEATYPEFLPALAAEAAAAPKEERAGTTIPAQKPAKSGTPQVRTAEDHVKAVSGQVDYSV